MLRELPETELSENSDYERWYFEGQPTVWEVEGKEVYKRREQPKTEHTLFLSGGYENGDTDRSSSTQNFDPHSPE
jgi:hypothetical protein